MSLLENHNKMVYKIIFPLLFLVNSYTCNCPQSNTPVIACPDETLFDQTLNINIERNIKLKILSDCDYNVTIKAIAATDNYVYDIAGAGSSWLRDKNNPVQEAKFDEEAEKEYYIKTFVYHSLYGADDLFIIWSSGSITLIHRFPYEKSFVRDIDNDGISEIISYERHSNDSTVFRFDNGNISLYK
jgi:hypothetical protein